MGGFMDLTLAEQFLIVDSICSRVYQLQGMVSHHEGTRIGETFKKEIVDLVALQEKLRLHGLMHGDFVIVGGDA
jgi:hypothetical protein